MHVLVLLKKTLSRSVGEGSLHSSMKKKKGMSINANMYEVDYKAVSQCEQTEHCTVMCIYQV